MAVTAAPAIAAGVGQAATTAAAAAATTAASAAILQSAATFAAKLALSYAISAVANSLLVRTPGRDGSAETLIGLPASTTDPGPPRVWACGGRVRVPAQVMWQDRKVRNSTLGSKKGGVQVRHVSFDCAFLLNDRPTRKLSQLIVNDGLVIWDSLNIVRVATSEMTVAESGGQVTFTMSSTEDPDFADTFADGDMVELSNFVAVSGPDLNGRYWEVVGVTGHTSAASTLTVEPRSGQTVASLNSTAGSPQAPGTVTRIDDAIVYHDWTTTITPYFGNFQVRLEVNGGNLPHHEPSEVFRVGDKIVISGCSLSALNGIELTALGTGSASWGFIAPASTGITLATVLTWGTASAPATFEFFTQPLTAGGYLPSSFVPSAHYYGGSEDQDEDDLIVAVEGSGNVGGFRGQAYQVLDDFDVTNFGGVLPPTPEALIDVDASFTWQDAILAICERHNIGNANVDASGVTPSPFLGYYLRGPVSGRQALQPILLVGQIATQERFDTLAFFDIANADAVQIQNGASFSDQGAQVGGDPKWEKESWADVSEEDMPSSVGVRFQDPDNFYGSNYEHWGIRHPSATQLENRNELDFRNLVMTRKQARNFAATVARRARYNGRTVETWLPSSYYHVLENDLLTWTDDEGYDHTIRVTQVEHGNNFLVRVSGVVERTDIGVSGSPVQSGAGVISAPLITPADITGVAFDSPPVLDEWGVVPGIHLVACTKPGGTWGGVTVYVSQDLGSNWTVAATLNQEHAVGWLTSALASATASEAVGSSTITWDTSNTVDIELDSVGEVPLVSLSEPQVLAGANWFAVIDSAGQVVEVFGARDVTQNSATNYTLGHLLRGIRGTFLGCASSHAAGTRVVSLAHWFPLSGEFYEIVGPSTPSTLQFKFVPAGGSLSSATAQTLQTRWRNVEPFPIRDITKSFDSGTTTVRFAFEHWTRRNLPVGYVPANGYPLDEAQETYRVTLYAQSGSGVPVVAKTVTAAGSGSPTIRDRYVEFTSSEQTAAGYTPSGTETYYIDIRHVGDYATSPSIYQEL